MVYYHLYVQDDNCEIEFHFYITYLSEKNDIFIYTYKLIAINSHFFIHYLHYYNVKSTGQLLDK